MSVKALKILDKLKGDFCSRDYFRLKAVFITVAVSLIISILLLNSALEKFELITLDYRFKLKPKRAGLSDIVFIDIAEDSIAQIGRWPFSRDWHAELISILTKYNARMVCLDVLFSEKSLEPLDNLLSEAIKKSGVVYLPFIFEPGAKTGIVNSLPIFTEYIKGSGFINIYPDLDGVIRRAPLLIPYKGANYPQLAFKMASDYLGVKPTDIRIPVDSQNQMLINWVGRWEEAFKHYSYIDVIVSYKQILDGIKPRIDLNALKNKICLVGLTAAGLSDIKPIPLQPLYPAVGVHANIIENIVNKNFVSRVNNSANTLLIMLICLFIGLLVPVFRPIKGFIFSLLILIAYITCAFLLFIFKGIWIDIVYPALSITLSYMAITLFTQITIAIEKARLFQLATRDGLTGLFVIRHFNLVLDTQLKESRDLKSPLSVIMSDIDHFKQFNDTYGHQTGDFILKEVARIFKSSCRQFDLAARYGGEEFILMLPNTPLEGAKNLAERLRKTIETGVFKDEKNQEYKVTISLGVATLTDETNKEELIKKADAALYKAKQAGRNQVCLA